MTKDVMVSSVNMGYEVMLEGEEIETIQWGQYYNKNGTHYVIYDELMEGFDEPVRNTIKFKEHEMNLTKKGLLNVYMVFEENKKNMTNYRTPYGTLLIGLDTSKVSLSEKEEEIKLDVEYSLDVNYEYLADCKIEIKIEPTGIQAD